jgi:hypothetical protein
MSGATVANCREQSPSLEAACRLAKQDITEFFGVPNFISVLPNSPTVGLVSILSRLDPLYTFPRHFTYSILTLWSRVLEKLTGFQLVKKFPAFYGTQRFITAFTSVRHLSLC